MQLADVVRVVPTARGKRRTKEAFGGPWSGDEPCGSSQFFSRGGGKSLTFRCTAFTLPYPSALRRAGTLLCCWYHVI